MYSHAATATRQRKGMREVRRRQVLGPVGQEVLPQLSGGTDGQLPRGDRHSGDPLLHGRPGDRPVLPRHQERSAAEWNVRMIFAEFLGDFYRILR